MSSLQYFIDYINMKNQQITESGLSLLSQLFPMRYLDPKTFPRYRAEDSEGYTLILNSTRPKALLNEIVAKFYHWNKMSSRQKKVFGDQLTSLVLSDFGMYYIFQKYNSNITSDLGVNSQAQIELAALDLLTERSPFPLLCTIVHELNHRRQDFVNCFAKKNHLINGKNVTYYPADLQAYSSYLKNKEKNDYYMACLYEKDSDLAGLNYLKRMRSILSSHKPSEKRDELLDELDDLITQEYERMLSHTKSEIKLKSIYNKQNNLEYSIIAKSAEFSSELQQIPAKSFSEYFDKKGYLALQDYLYFATTHVDRETHKRILHTLLRHNRIEAIDLVNTIGYYHSNDELLAASRILFSHTDDSLLLPTMFRYFTHIPSDQIIKTAETLLDKTDVAVCERAMQLQFEKNLAESKISRFNNITLDPRNRDHYSFFMNCFYSENYQDFVDTFTPEYMPDLLQTLTSQINPSQTFSEDQTYTIIDKTIDKVSQDRTLYLHDEHFEILDNPDGFSDDVSLTDEELHEYGNTSSYYFDTKSR